MNYNDNRQFETAGSTATGTSGVGSSSTNAASTGNVRGNVSRRVLSAGTLAGDRVRNRNGEDLGKIEEIMIDLESGRVAYAVLSFGGFLGIGDKLFAVPWESLELNAAEHEFVLDVDKQTLENAPGFDKDNWPDMADTTWGQQVHSHYGQRPYWEETSREDIETSSYDTGLDLEDAQSSGSSSTGRYASAGQGRTDY
jgi:sporulation protein YlmC with PRC-barrel domain